MIERKAWPCPNCGTNLGTVVSGEIAVDRVVELINTQGVNLVLTCPQCGRPKVWYAKEDAVLTASQRVQARLIAQAMRNLAERGS